MASASHPNILVGQLLETTLQMLSRMEIEELCLLLICVLPLMSVLRTICRSPAGASEELSRDKEECAPDDVRALSRKIDLLSAALSEQTRSAKEGIQRVESCVASLQQNAGAHNSKFGDLHKDLAGIVWELSKLRSDVARWQAPSHAAGTAKAQGGIAAGASRASMPAQRCSPRDLEAQTGSGRQ
ncbi:hypothetical protein AB1Y20_013137 [Prymnesium parvum]|uniref:Biogenesis of lysosome-related organelles complex 1 subunit 7 n=1 Tax=Prymnesium parvum TaxID=97485 RepID=A0AB34IMJ8_PRYPA